MASIPRDATLEQLRQIALDAIDAAARERERANAATAMAAAATTTGAWRRKKPDLPTFDKQHIDLWIKRVESAYQREGVTEAKDKFAFLESNIGVNISSTINEFLFGDATADNWILFLEQLRTEFGRSKAQRVASILDDLKRDGHRPSQLLARLREDSKEVTMDDVYKEKILRALPIDIRQTMQSQIYLLDAGGVAELADSHFDQQGRQLNTAAGASEVSSVVEDLDDGDQVNAVNQRQFNGRNRGGFSSGPSSSWSNSSNAPFRAGQAPASSAPRPPSTAGRQAAANSSSSEKLCMFHRRHGDQARTCQTGCSRFNAFMASQKAGNGRGGRQ